MAILGSLCFTSLLNQWEPNRAKWEPELVSVDPDFTVYTQPGADLMPPPPKKELTIYNKCGARDHTTGFCANNQAYSIIPECRQAESDKAIRPEPREVYPLY